ncbi:MAG: S4 domain-containing protein [Pseudomonadales bacterium]
MRLDKFLAHATEMTRQQAQRAVRVGDVSVNGVVVQQTAQQLTDRDVVTLCGDVLQKIQPRYFMLHKPIGYICANSDGHHPVVLDLLPGRVASLQVVGRLDIDTGLVLLTDDGQWNHRLPRQ